MFTKKEDKALLEILHREFEQLLDAKEIIDKEIAKRSQSEMEKAKSRMASMASAMGTTIANIFGIEAIVAHHREKKDRKKRSVAIKYRDPANPENTWTGLGKPKKWLQEKIDAGEDKENYRIAEPSAPLRLGEALAQARKAIAEEAPPK